MKFIYSFCLFFLIVNNLAAQKNINLVSNLPYNQFVNDIWGYVAEDGTEYALVGTKIGVSIVSLADNTNPVEVAFIQGSNSIWRDIKTYGNRAYVTSDEGDDGLLIIDLSELPETTSHYFWRTTLEGGTDSLSSCHNLYIDENGYCYLSGSNLNSGGLLILDIFSDPNQPKLVGMGQAVYSHDIYVRNNIAYSSDIEDGNLTIHDVSDKGNVKLLASQQTPFAFTHNAWLSDDGKTIFITEERENAPTTAYDISDLNDIKELNQFVPLATKGLGVIPHNVHVLNDFLVISHYGDGCVILDASRPNNLIEVGNFDTAPDVVGGFGGSWGAYPFLPSGLILMSDSENGLFVLEPSYQNACFLEGSVTNATTNDPIPGVAITISNLNISVNSDLKGDFHTGLVDSGTYEVTISKRGFKTQTTSVELNNGEVSLLLIELEPSPSFNLTGSVTIEESGTPIENAQVQIMSNGIIWTTVSDENGQVKFDTFFEDSYTILTGKWAYKTQIINDLVLNETNNTFTIRLEKGIEDPFALDLGWTVTNEEETFGGVFEFGVPVPNELPLLSRDVIGDIGQSCYTTGNKSSFQEGLFFVGKTILTSPIFDISGMMNPQIAYHINFGNGIFGDDGLIIGIDTLYVHLNNGTENVIIDKITTDLDFENMNFPQWNESIIKVSDFVAPSEEMTISFEVNSENFESIIEAGVDNFRVWDGGTVSTHDYIEEELGFSIYPNPFIQQIYVEFDINQWDKRPTVILYDILGKELLQQTLAVNQLVQIPPNLNAGIYFIQLVEKNKSSRLIKLVK